MAVGSHSMVAPGTPQPLFDVLRAGYEGPFVVAQDFTIINVTPEQIVTRMAKFEPGPFLVSDPEYVERMGGSKSDPDAVRAGMPDWLSDSDHRRAQDRGLQGGVEAERRALAALESTDPPWSVS